MARCRASVGAAGRRSASARAGKRGATGEDTSEPALAGKAAPSAPAERDKEARKLYERGIQALSAKQWDKAREALSEAFKLKPHPQIAANLGHAELMAGRFQDAAEHLSFVLREGQGLSAQDRQDIEKMLTDATAKIGTVTIQVNIAGARVLLEAQEVGVSPLSAPLFVEPGSRAFEANQHAPMARKMVMRQT